MAERTPAQLQAGEVGTSPPDESFPTSNTPSAGATAIGDSQDAIAPTEAPPRSLVFPLTTLVVTALALELAGAELVRLLPSSEPTSVALRWLTVALQHPIRTPLSLLLLIGALLGDSRRHRRDPGPLG